MANSKDGFADSGAPATGATAPEEARKSPTAMTPAEREEALIRQRALGKQLKPLWDDVTKEPLPDDFLSLLNDMAPEDSDGSAGAR
jgi:hypothetical protein